MSSFHFQIIALKNSHFEFLPSESQFWPVFRRMTLHYKYRPVLWSAHNVFILQATRHICTTNRGQCCGLLTVSSLCWLQDTRTCTTNRGQCCGLLTVSSLCRLQEVCAGGPWLGRNSCLVICSDQPRDGGTLHCHELPLLCSLHQASLLWFQPDQEVLVNLTASLTLSHTQASPYQPVPTAPPPPSPVYLSPFN